MSWYHLATDQGHANAQLSLGLMYFIEEGVPQDYVQAHLWFNLAASRATDQEDDPFLLENAVSVRDALASLMTADQLAEAERLAREWDAAHPQ